MRWKIKRTKENDEHHLHALSEFSLVILRYIATSIGLAGTNDDTHFRKSLISFSRIFSDYCRMIPFMLNCCAFDNLNIVESTNIWSTKCDDNINIKHSTHFSKPPLSSRVQLWKCGIRLRFLDICRFPIRALCIQFIL